MKIVLTYAASWVGLAVLGVLNGLLREHGYRQFTSELTAHQLSTAIALGLFSLYLWGLTHIWSIESPRQAYAIGATWLGLTIVFEFVFGHYVVGHPWSSLVRDYNLLEGRLWVLVLIWTAAGPYVFYRLRS